VRRAARFAALCLAAALAASCNPPGVVGGERGGGERRGGERRGDDPAAAQRAIRDWLECEECWDGELGKLVAFGDAVVPSLAATLREGMSPAGRALLSRQLAERYDERVAWADANPQTETRPELTKDEYVTHHVKNRDALYRVRAARALAAIGTPAALAALREELAHTQHEGVRDEIRRLLGEPTAPD
jgi:hypothetical protein